MSSSSPSTSKSSSVLNRPRPNSPGPASSFSPNAQGFFASPSSMYSSYARSPSPISSPAHSHTNSSPSLPGNSPYTRHTVFSQSPVLDQATHERSRSTSILNPSRPRTPDSGSVLNRGRPNTPDSFAWLERGGIPSSASTSSLSRIATTSQPMATHFSQSSAPLPSTSSYAPPAAAAAMPRSSSQRSFSTNDPPASQSFESARSTSTWSRQSGSSSRGSFSDGTWARDERKAGLGLAPMLSLDLDLGSSGEGSMFDLASLLKVGDASTPSPTRERSNQERRQSSSSVRAAALRATKEGKRLPELQQQREEEEAEPVTVPVPQPVVEKKVLQMKLDLSTIAPPLTTMQGSNGARTSPRGDVHQSATYYSSIPLSPTASPLPLPEPHSPPYVANPPTPTKEKEKERRPSHTSTVGDATILWSTGTYDMRKSPSATSLGGHSPKIVSPSPTIPPAPPKIPSPPAPTKSASLSSGSLHGASPEPRSAPSPIPPKVPSSSSLALKAPSPASGVTARPPPTRIPPIKRPSVSLDKSLPPTPTKLAAITAAPPPVPIPVPVLVPAPMLPATSTSAASSTIAALPDDSPTKGSSPFKRGMMRLKSTSGKSGFQLVTATTSKKALRQGSITSLSSTTSPPAPSLAEQSKNQLGRRLVDRFTVGRGANASSSGESLGRTRTREGLDGSPDLKSDEHPLQSERKFPRPPRRASISALSDEKPRSASVLGMGLHAARRSEDLLTSTAARHAESEGGRGNVGDEPPFVGRKSFDLLIQRKEVPVPRRPSTDDLLILATAELSKISLASQSQSSANIASPTTIDSARASSPSLHDSTPVSPNSLDASPEKASVAVATRVVRTDSPLPESPILNRPVVPSKLVRTDSIRADSSKSDSKSGEEGGASDGSGQQTPTPVVVTAVQPANIQPPWRKRVKIPDSGHGSDSSMSSAWLDVEDALAAYSTAVTEDRADRGNIVSNILLPFLRREEDVTGPKADEQLAKRQRQILFRWLATLTTELREMQPTHRGACLEAVASIAECRFLTVPALESDPAGQARYRSAVVDVLQFAIEKLNDKAVYANTLVFSGRVLALAFFRIEGVALKLLRALPPVKRPILRRIMDEANVQPEQLPPVDLEAFPAHLWTLCLRDFKVYTELLLSPVPKAVSGDGQFLVKDGAVAVEMSGNWLIRWTASDSDLPFAFYRAYHRQLASYLIPQELRYTLSEDPPLPPSLVIPAPGFLFLAASLLDKCDGLIRVNLRSVTSIGPSTSGNFANESANFSFGQKPKVLELANRRLVSTMLDIVGGPPLAPGDAGDAPPDSDIRRQSFSKVLQVWIRACVKRTSMWNTRSVFILLDLIEGLIYTLSYPPPSSKGSSEDVIVPRPHEFCLEMFDISFIFSFVKIILAKADNTIAIMRTIAFIYAHFEIFTLRSADRDELCENIILDSELFPRLYLHWNAGVRGYFIRLLVWRLARLGIVEQEQRPTVARDPHILAIFGLMNVRLEAIRKRHDELEPYDNLTDDDLFRPKRSTICSTRGVKEAPYAVDELTLPLTEDSEEEEDEPEDEPEELMRPNIQPPPKKGNGIKEVATVARVVSWLKGGLGKSKQNNGASNGTNGSGGSSGRQTTPVTPVTKKTRLPAPPAMIDPFVLDYDSITPSSRRDAEDFELDDSPPSSSSGHDSSWSAISISSPGPVDRALVPTNAPAATPDRIPDRLTPDRTRLRRSSPTSPSFFSFEFEGGVAPRSDVDAAPASSGASSSGASVDTVFPSSPIRRNLEPQSAVSPRVSLRFSKRISILPPAALDMLKESGEAVPPIPAQYLSGSSTGYDKKLHPYAIRGLRDYEDALDEWTDWVARLQEEEDEGKMHSRGGFVDTVPRLSVSWSNAFSDDP